MCIMSLEKTLRVRFMELVLDLLQDTSGTWWLLQVKAFKLTSVPLPSLSRTQSAPTRFEIGVVPTPQWKKWRCAGRYCTGYLTKKMVRSCEFYDDFVQQQDVSLAGGFAEFHSALTFHLQHRLPKRDRSQLYEPQALCRTCIKRYHSLRQQWKETQRWKKC
ncbi:uncharacterized protein PITG_11163 [Phytophthora infestans T30-4]|uniref:Uncharacterized protein n=1 Tax=Phytophthora infestans (strain T30-4) TaxID=403677 RepID=D0NGB9_PHYIT|nr:uncharacterized protein PITG_11163 [Phytophthora infestans T30-4]EEY57320.1 hypothetical protein PITG_11163 [Phytophthora infestans T30-4]|eukprot:XP_002901930.1 hypothetical protein PITG_11163 [Phytophthora infestans T30-4]